MDMEPPSNEIWHRPEFQDRRQELINNAQAAALVGVHFVTLSTWKQRFLDFPEAVLSFKNSQEQMIHKGEFLEWHGQYTATRGQRGRPNYVAPTSRQRSEPELRTLLAELHEKRQALQNRIERLDTRIAKTEASLRDAQAHLKAEKAIGDAIELISQVDTGRRDQFVETALDRAEEQWSSPTGDAGTATPANDPVATAFPPIDPQPASTDHADQYHAFEADAEAAAHMQR